MEVVAQCFGIDGNEFAGAKSASRMLTNDTDCPLCNTQQPTQPPLALAVPLSRFTSRVGGGSAFFVRLLRHYENTISNFLTRCEPLLLCTNGYQSHWCWCLVRTCR